MECHVLYQMFPKCVLGKVGHSRNYNSKKKKSVNQRQFDYTFESLKLWSSGREGIIECWRRCNILRPVFKKPVSNMEAKVKRCKNMVRLGDMVML